METITLAFNTMGTLLSIVMVLGLLSIVYLWIYYRIRNWKQIKNQQNARLWAGISTVIGTPLLTVLIVGSTMAYYYYSDVLSNKLTSYSLYDITDDMIQEMDLVGKSKKEVVYLLGSTDTTRSELVYDFSREEAVPSSIRQKLQKYILVVKFKNGKAISYHREK